MSQVEAVTKAVDKSVEEAAKLRHDGCTGNIILVTYQSVSLQALSIASSTHLPISSKSM